MVHCANNTSKSFFFFFLLGFLFVCLLITCFPQAVLYRASVSKASLAWNNLFKMCILSQWRKQLKPILLHIRSDYGCVLKACELPAVNHGVEWLGFDPDRERGSSCCEPDSQIPPLLSFSSSVDPSCWISHLIAVRRQTDTCPHWHSAVRINSFIPQIKLWGD